MTTVQEAKNQIDAAHLTWWFRKTGTTTQISDFDYGLTVSSIYYSYNGEAGSVIIYVNVPDEAPGDSGNTDSGNTNP